MPTGDTSKLKRGNTRTKGRRDQVGSLYTPIVISTWGGMGKEAATFYKRLADMIASKRQNPYPVVMLRCRLSFASIRSAIMCIRGSRSSLHTPVYMDNITLVSQEGRVPPPEYIIIKELWHPLCSISPSSTFDCSLCSYNHFLLLYIVIFLSPEMESFNSLFWVGL